MIMDYEKKYKAALGWMQGLYNGLHGKTKEEAERFFPELAESEDEKIRKELINIINLSYDCGIAITKENYKKYIAWLEKQESVGEIVERCKTSWYNEGKIQGQIEGLSDDEKYLQGWHDALEKQGEQKTFDYEHVNIQQKDFAPKIDPKFHEGDWITIDKPCQIIGINDNGDYRVRYCDDERTYVRSKNFCETYFHLWSIEETKPGDVLNAIGAPFIYKKHDENYVYFYCGINLADEFIKANNIEPWNNNSKVYPATKEQRDYLFKKMHEAGYEWNAEKKELKKIEADVQLTEFEEEIRDMMDDYRDAIDGHNVTIEEVKEKAAYLLSLIHQNHAWSEEDECYMTECINAIATKDSWSFEEKRNTKHWLKSLKQRIGGEE